MHLFAKDRFALLLLIPSTLGSTADNVQTMLMPCDSLELELQDPQVDETAKAEVALVVGENPKAEDASVEGIPPVVDEAPAPVVVENPKAEVASVEGIPPVADEAPKAEVAPVVVENPKAEVAVEKGIPKDNLCPAPVAKVFARVEVPPAPVLQKAVETLANENEDSEDFRRKQLLMRNTEKEKAEADREEKKQNKQKNKKGGDPKPKGRPRKVDPAPAKDAEKAAEPASKKRKTKKDDNKKDDKENKDVKENKENNEDKAAPKKKRAKPAAKGKEAKKDDDKVVQGQKRKAAGMEGPVDDMLKAEFLDVMEKYHGHPYDKQAETIHKCLNWLFFLQLSSFWYFFM